MSARFGNGRRGRGGRGVTVTRVDLARRRFAKAENSSREGEDAKTVARRVKRVFEFHVFVNLDKIVKIKNGVGAENAC